MSTCAHCMKNTVSFDTSSHASLRTFILISSVAFTLHLVKSYTNKYLFSRQLLNHHVKQLYRMMDLALSTH